MVNPSRYPPSGLAKLWRTDQVYISAATITDRPVQLLTFGIVTEEWLTSVRETQRGKVRDISISPITQEFERNISCLQMVFGCKLLILPVWRTALQYTSRFLSRNNQGNCFHCNWPPPAHPPSRHPRTHSSLFRTGVPNDTVGR